MKSCVVNSEGGSRSGAIDPLQTRPEGSKIGLLSPETLDLDLKNAIFGPKFESSKTLSGTSPECLEDIGVSKSVRTVPVTTLILCLNQEYSKTVR